MSTYTVKKRKPFTRPHQEMVGHLTGVLADLGGKPTKANNPDGGKLSYNFNKKVGNRAMGNRVQLDIAVKEQPTDGSMVAIIGYPVDPLGNKLGFGVNGDPARVVIDAVFTALS